MGTESETHKYGVCW